MVLAGVLVALNLVLWLAPPGLALRQIALTKLFGPKLVRAEVIVSTGGTSTADWRVNRGVIVTVSPDLTGVTLREADGRLQTIDLDSSTRVLFRTRILPLLALQPGWRVLVTWPANGAADTVQVESRRSGNGLGKPSGSSGGFGAHTSTGLF